MWIRNKVREKIVEYNWRKRNKHNSTYLSKKYNMNMDLWGKERMEKYQYCHIMIFPNFLLEIIVLLRLK